MAKIFVRQARQTQRGAPATITHSRPRITPAIAARDIETVITAFQNIQSFSLYAGAVLGVDACSTTLAVNCTDSISCTLYPTAFILTENPTTMSWTYIYPFNGTPWSYAAACTNFQDDSLPIQGECYDVTTIGYGQSAFTVSTSNFPISFVTDYFAPLPITSGAERLPSPGGEPACAVSPTASSLPPSISPVPGTIYTSDLPPTPVYTGSAGSTNSSSGISTSPSTATGVSTTPGFSLQNIATTDPSETQSRIKLGGSVTPSPAPHPGLSKGGVIGVAVAVPVGVIAIAVAAGILLWKRRKDANAGAGGMGTSSFGYGEGASQGVTEIQNVGPYHR